MSIKPPVSFTRLRGNRRRALCAIAVLAIGSVSAAVETYQTASIDQNGQLRIVTTDRREIVPKKERDQAGFDKPAISEDRRVVGWLALYPNCCTSYPIPLKLMTYANGKRRTFTGAGLPIWQWRFVEGGKQIAFEQETVHRGLGVHFELHDTGTGRLIAEYSPDAPGAPTLVPQWVRDLGFQR
jgi:hypothetical protein